MKNELRSGVPDRLGLVAEAWPRLLLDYGWLTEDALVLVERKEINDLGSSLRSGRLRDQLEKAKKVTNHIWLLVEGQLPATVGGYLAIPGQWRYRDFMSALGALLHGLQVNGPIWTLDFRQSAEALLALWTQTSRESLGSGKPMLPKWKHTVHGSVPESFANGLRRIRLGYGRACELVKVAPSWIKLTKLTTTHLRKVPGIGPIMAQKIYDELRREDVRNNHA